MNAKPQVRLLALNLVLVLLCSVAAPAWAAEPEAQKAPLREACAGTYFSEPAPQAESEEEEIVLYSDTDDAGEGWRYDAKSETLYLENEYIPKPIESSGDLTIYSKGNVTVSGGLEVYGKLEIYNNGDLDIRGGTYLADNGTMQGGDAIQAGGDVSIITGGSGVTLTGGSAAWYNPNSTGGSGINTARNVYLLQAPLGDSVYEGRQAPNAKITIRGGDGGRFGGDAVISGGDGLLLDGNAEITGGDGTYLDGRAVAFTGAGSLMYGDSLEGNLDTASLSSYTSLNATLRSGSGSEATIESGTGRVAAVGKYLMGPPQYNSEGTKDIIKFLSPISPHVDYRISGAVTAASLQFYAKTYTTTINGNGGTVNGQSSRTVRGEYPSRVNLSSYTYARPGYTLSGFTVNGRSVSANYSFIPAENTTVTAQWRSGGAAYTVTYDANGGSGAPAAQTKTQNQSLTLSSTRPTRSGYTFAGWATSSNGSVQYQPGGTYTGNANLILYAVWTPVSTAGADITVGSGTASPGGTIGIPVSIRNNPGIAGAQFTISYDKSVMTLERIERGSIFSNGNYTGDAGRNLVQWYNTSNSTSNGTMFTLYFKVNQTARSGRYSVGLQYQTDNICDQNKKPVQIKIEEGAVSVVAGQLGDVTGDGRIAINDVVKLAQSVAGYTTLTSQEQALADVTHDGRIAINDVVKLAQYVAGYITSL